MSTQNEEFLDALVDQMVLDFSEPDPKVVE